MLMKMLQKKKKGIPVRATPCLVKCLLLGIPF